MTAPGCSIEDCSGSVHGRGLCELHYRRWQRHGDPLHVSPGPVARFWAKVDTSAGLFGCWPWLASRNAHGYGHFDGSSAHRFSLELALGRPLAAGMFACHTCDNPPCCNPGHLFEGTHQDNVDDRTKKGRSAVGDHVPPERRIRGDRHPARRIPGWRAGVRNGRHRLQEDDVRAIRGRLSAGVRWIDIAAEFGISKGAVAHIAARRTWQHVA